MSGIRSNKKGGKLLERRDVLVEVSAVLRVDEDDETNRAASFQEGSQQLTVSQQLATAKRDIRDGPRGRKYSE